MSEEIKVSFIEAEVTKISLNPGDVLAIKITEYLDPSHLTVLQKNLKNIFPNNKIAIFCLSETGKIEFESISSDQSDCSVSTNYCEDCSCGKKEQAESQFPQLKDDNAGPGEEDGPWAPGWEERSGQKKGNDSE